MFSVRFCLLLLLNYIVSKAWAFGIGSTLYCYQCVSTHPGCGEFNWWLQWSQACPEADDSCVKIVERKGAMEIITRDCLSSLKPIRTDIPADHYEGCRKGTVDVKLANYVNNTIKELDIKRDHYDDTTWCFCRFDNRCNSASTISITVPLVVVLVVIPLLSRLPI